MKWNTLFNSENERHFIENPPGLREENPERGEELQRRAMCRHWEGTAYGVYF